MTSARIMALKQLGRTNYKMYLRSEHWQTIRHAALQRSGFACVVCNAKADLHVHHRTYENLGEERDSDLTVLCAACHKTHHFGEKLGIGTEPTEARLAEVAKSIWDYYLADVSEIVATHEGLYDHQWVFWIWLQTGIPTIYDIALWRTAATGEEEIEYEWRTLAEVAAKGSPWHVASAGKMLEWCDELLKDEDFEIAVAAAKGELASRERRDL